jgi:hypothetical protein
MPTRKLPDKPKFYLAGDGKGPPTLGDVLALYRCLTGKEATPEEIEKAKQKIAAFASVDPDQVTLDTRIGPAKSEPRPSSEDENAADESH